MIELMGSLPFAPEPDPDLVLRLQMVDERLGLRYLPIGEGCWAFTEKWGENDPRRARIQSGELAPGSDFDILGFAPEGVRSEDALGLLTEKLRRRVTDQPEYQKMLDGCILQNKLQTHANLSGVRDFAHELFEANEENMGAKAVHRGAGFSLEDGKVVGTPYQPKRGMTKSERDARAEMSDK